MLAAAATHCPSPSRRVDDAPPAIVPLTVDIGSGEKYLVPPALLGSVVTAYEGGVNEEGRWGWGLWAWPGGLGSAPPTPL